MARVFLSHSSGNNAEAIAVRDWLIGHGWDDLFLDLDPGKRDHKVTVTPPPGDKKDRPYYYGWRPGISLWFGF
jgi:hypothetical protein